MSSTPLNKFLNHISLRDRHRSPRDAAAQAQSESGIDFSERVQRKLFSTIQRPSASVRKRPSIKHVPLVAGPEYGAAFTDAPLPPFATHMISPTKANPPGAFPATPDLGSQTLEETGGINETTEEREKGKEKEKEDRAKSLRKSFRRSFQSLTQRPSSAPGTRPFDENPIASSAGVMLPTRGPAPPRPPRPEERARMTRGLERTSDSIISMTEALSTPPMPTVSTLPPLRKPVTSQTPQTPTRLGSPPISLRSSLSLSKRSSFPPFAAPSSPILEHPYEGSPPKSAADGGPWLPPFVPTSPGPMIPGAWAYTNSNTAGTVGSQKGSPPKLRLRRKPTFSSQAPTSHSPSSYENSFGLVSSTAFPTPVRGAFTSPGNGSPSQSPSMMTFPEYAPGPLRISEHNSPQNSSLSTFPTPGLTSQYGSPLKVSTPIFPSDETPRQGSFSSPKPPFTAQGPKFPERVPNTEELDLWWINLGDKQKMACKEIFETLTGLFDSTYPMLMPSGEE